MQIAQLMKEAPASIPPSASIEQAAARMKEIGCGVLPVADSGEPLGVITDRDIVLRCIAAGRDPRVMTVAECCSEPAICCHEDCSADEAFHTMREHGIGRLVVTDSCGKLMGMVSLADIIARVPKEIWNQLPGAERPMPRRAA